MILNTETKQYVCCHAAVLDNLPLFRCILLRRLNKWAGQVDPDTSGRWDELQSSSGSGTCYIDLHASAGITARQRQKMVFLTTKIMQRTALFVTFGGFVTSLINAFLPFWKTMNSDLNEMENWFSGLWHTCLYTEEVGIQCKAYDSVLGLPLELQISRWLVTVSIGTGGLGLLVVLPGLEGVEMCVEQPHLKRRFIILAGLLTWVSGLTSLAPVSLVAYSTLVDFFDEGWPEVMPRWEYGEAMFSGWFGGLGQLIGGTLLFIAVCMYDFDQRPPSVPNSPQVKHRTKDYQKTEVL